MLMIIPHLLADLLNIIAIKYYFDTFFTAKRKKASPPLFWCIAILGEGLLFFVSNRLISGYHPFRPFIFLFINLTCLFILSSFYTANTLLFRILIVTSLQAIGALTEAVSGSFLSIISPQFSNYDFKLEETYVIIVSQIFFFLIVSVICTLWKSKKDYLSIKHLILICFTPFCSLLILLSMSYNTVTSDETNRFVLSVFCIMLSLNVINHVLLNEILKETSLQNTILNQEKQLSAQSEKYSQLSNAYRETRSIIHEVKRYNSYIKSCIQNSEYDKIEEFLENGSRELEERFIKINTGNLVIDTLITNCTTLTEKENIPFKSEIRIDKDDIAINDYDLCIILGNLIDNCINESRNWHSSVGSYEGFDILIRIFQNGNFIVINTKNPFIKRSNHKSDNLYHGYGLANVERIVTKYGGIYYQKADNAIFETTVSIPILRDSTGSVVKQPE